MFFHAKCFHNRVLRSLAVGGTLWPEAAAFGMAPELRNTNCGRALKVLLVVAHPDDESECAAVLYWITHELGGTVDQAIITNGEAGYQHSRPRDHTTGCRLLMNVRGVSFSLKSAGRKSSAPVRSWVSATPTFSIRRIPVSLSVGTGSTTAMSNEFLDMVNKPLRFKDDAVSSSD